jgi:hypothetical protein
MRGYDDSTPSSSRNAFSPLFLRRLGRRDEPPTAGEADLAGPWRVEEIPGRGWGLFRLGESPEEVPPFAVTPSPWLAWVLAAVLPSLGRDAAYRLDKERGSEGFAVRDGAGQVVVYLGLFDPNLVEALNWADGLLRSPESLAWLLEGAGSVALERAGAILEGRVG